MSTENTTLMTAEEANVILVTALQAAGCDENNATALADNICAAELAGAHSHGLFRVPGYVAALKSGKVNGCAKPKLSQPRPGIVHVDGDGGFAPTSHRAMLELVCDAAKAQGVVIVALRNIHHFSALWVEVEGLAERGLVALACTSYKPALPPAGGNRPLYGTNPIAFGVPRVGTRPMVFDQASAVMARGEVMLAARAGRSLPDGVGIGPDGLPTNDPNEVLKGALLPFGGYKGAALAMMVELLAGPLIGETLSFETAAGDNNDGGPPRGGEFIIAIDPGGARGGSGFTEHAERLFAEMLKQDGVRLPGDRRAKARQASGGFIGIPDETAQLLRELVAD